MTTLLSKHEAAIKLGVSTRTLDREIAARRLPFRLVGARRRFDPDELVTYSMRHRSSLSAPLVRI